MDVVLNGQTVTNIFERTKCCTMLDQIFDVVQILSNTIKQGVQTGKCLVVFARQNIPRLNRVLDKKNRTTRES